MKPLAELRSFLDGLPEPRIVMDRDYRIVAANQAYLREFGSGQPIVGRTCYEVSHRFSVPCDQAGESCPLKQTLERGSAQRVLHLHHTPRGEEHVDVETTPIRNDKGELVYFVESMRVVRQASGRAAAQGMVGRSPVFSRLLEQLLRVAPTNAAVLLRGETGTGKELVARAIHEASERSAGPFVTVDCSGLTESLFESELFGYEKGAFTGANFRKLGLVEAASGGTLFLDEIGELPLTLQVKLLRLLEAGTYRRVGGLDSLRADFRLVAATHRDLLAMVQNETFRRDLFFRLNTFPIHTPSLSERREDIPLLAISLLERVDRKRGRSIAPEAQAWLRDQHYSGNIRELRNLIERASILADTETLSLQHFMDAKALEGVGEIDNGPMTAQVGFSLSGPVALDQLEQIYLSWLAAQPGASMVEMAKTLGVSQRTLYRKLQAFRATDGLHPGEAETTELPY